MSNERRLDNCAEHREVSGLIPWYVNSTLDEPVRRRVDAHIGACAVCGDDLRVQRRLLEAIGSATTLDYVPMASLRRLQARLDVQAQEPAPTLPAVAGTHARSNTSDVAHLDGLHPFAGVDGCGGAAVGRSLGPTRCTRRGARSTAR